MKAPRRSLSGPTRLLLESLADRRAADPLLAFPPEPEVPALLAPSFPRLSCRYLDYATWRQARQTALPEGVELLFGDDWPGEGRHDLAAIYLPQSRPAIEFAFAGLSPLLAPGAEVLVVGAKKSGIRSSRGLMERYFGAPPTSRPGRHSVLLRCRKTGSAPSFDGTLRYRVAAWGVDFEVASCPGTFSHGRLDDGTRFLFDHFTPGAGRRVLDVGCGCGVIGTAIALARPRAAVDLVDSSALALASTRRTLAAAGVRSAAVRASDVYSDVAGRYDLIVSNPPFHRGLDTDHRVTRRLIHQARRHLARRGRLVLVVNSFLPLERDLRAAFERVETVARDRRFKVLAAASPQPLPPPSSARRSTGTGGRSSSSSRPVLSPAGM